MEKALCPAGARAGEGASLQEDAGGGGRVVARRWGAAP